MLSKTSFKIFLLSIALLAASCSSARRVSDSVPKANVSSTGNAELDYINTYKDIAISEMRRTGVPASITLAQGMIESNYGRSELARRGNNHFGIKCHDWRGPSIYHDDDRRNECFRKYSNPEESFIDHSNFLRSGSRYSFLFELDPDDYRSWARGLKKAGYATNPDYADMLIRKIEQQGLTAYDKGFGGTRKPADRVTQLPEKTSREMTASVENETIVARPSRIQVNNRIEYIIVRDGDTREKIENEYKLLSWELPKYNDLDNDFELLPGQILYLQPKRDKADVGNDSYTTKVGDTMIYISQKYGIKLKSLYSMNRMEEGSEPVPGTKLWLRGMKPVY